MPVRRGRYAVIVAVGVVLFAAAEWVRSGQLQLWRYDPRHPTVPGLGVGVLAVLQPAVLLPMTFWLASRRHVATV